MASNNRTNDSFWVDQRLATLEVEPEWQPNVNKALSELHGRYRDMQVRRVKLIWGAVAGLMICIGLPAFPAVRVLAHRLWDDLVLRRVEVVRFNSNTWPDNLLQGQIIGEGRPERVADATEAQSKAAFQVTLPRPEVLDGGPKLFVVNPIVAQLVVHTAPIEQALTRLGASDVIIPREWDGAE